jgi:RNA polymerase sigma factor (sigma-70 family)
LLVEPSWTDHASAPLLQAVGRLSRRQRAVIVLRYFADWPEADIAAALDCRHVAVRSLLARARRQLAQELRNHE